MKISEYDAGRYNVLRDLSSADYGKQRFFLQDNLLVFDRMKCDYNTLDDVIKRFAKELENI